MGVIGRRALLVAVVCGWGLSSVAWAAPSERERTLAGVSAVFVDVAPVGGGPETSGLSAGAIRGAVEARLAARRIRAAGQEERDVRQLPTLYVRLLILPARPAVVAYYVAVELWQAASVGGGPAPATAYVPTWSSLGYLGAADGPPALAAALEEALARQLDQFLAAHTAANPSR